MRNRSAVLPALLVSALLAASCSSDDDDDTPDGPLDDATEEADQIEGEEDEQESLTALEGRWQGPCGLSGQGLYQRYTFEVRGASFALVNRTFPGAACAQGTESVVVESEGTLAADSPAPLDGAVGGELDRNFETIDLTPLTPGAADQLNAIALCERTDYAVDVPVDVIGCPALGTENLPATSYDRYLIEDDTLYLNAERGTSAETRPEEVDFTTPYTRLP